MPQENPNWVLAELRKRYMQNTGRDLEITAPLLGDPLMERLLRAEIALLMHDSHIVTARRTVIYRHLVRLGLSFEQIAKILDLSDHTIRTGATQVRCKLASMLRHQDEYSYLFNGPVPEEDIKLIEEHLIHVDAHKVNKNSVAVAY